MILVDVSHKEMKFGLPVFVDSVTGDIVPYGRGLKGAVFFLGWSNSELAYKCGYKSEFTLARFFAGRADPPAHVMLVIYNALKERGF